MGTLYECAGVKPLTDRAFRVEYCPICIRHLRCRVAVVRSLLLTEKVGSFLFG